MDGFYFYALEHTDIGLFFVPIIAWVNSSRECGNMFRRLFPNADRLLDVEDLREENDEIRNLYSQMEQKVEETQKAEKSAGQECRGSKKKTSRGEER